jgi:hypothetical protein
MAVNLEPEPKNTNEGDFRIELNDKRSPELPEKTPESIPEKKCIATTHTMKNGEHVILEMCGMPRIIGDSPPGEFTGSLDTLLASAETTHAQHP